MKKAVQAKCILVVDDDKDVREVLRDFFKIEGFEVYEAYDGEKALQMIQERPFDVVLTDIRMPARDGLSLLREIKQIRPEATVLMITAYPSPANTVKALEFGCDGYVSKPFGLERLKYMVHRCLSKRQWLPQEPGA